MEARTELKLLQPTSVESSGLPAGGDPGEVVVNTAPGEGDWASLVVADVAGAAPLASPALTGNPTAPTATPGDNDTSISTTAFVSAAITAHVAATDPHGDRAYADGLFAANDALVYRGAIDASANPNYPAASAGHVYKISVAGKIGGGSGANVEVGDSILCTVDGTSAGTQAAVGANWSIVQTNLDGAVIGPASAVSGNLATFSGTGGKLIQDSGLALDTDGTLAANSDAKIASQKAVKTAVDLKAALASPALTGTPTVPTAAQGTNTTQAASTAYVQTEAGLLVPKSLVDAKGDLLVGTADNTVARKAAGTNGDSLRVDASSSDGLRWGIPGALSRLAGYSTGRYVYPSYQSGQTAAQSSSTGGVWGCHIWLPGGITFDQIVCEITTIGSAGALVRLGAWNVDSNGLPTTVALDGGTVAGDGTTGIKAASISWTPTLGIYVLAAVSQVAAVTLRFSRTINTLALPAAMAGSAYGALRNVSSQPATNSALVSCAGQTFVDDTYAHLIGLRIA